MNYQAKLKVTMATAVLCFLALNMVCAAEHQGDETDSNNPKTIPSSAPSFKKPANNWRNADVLDKKGNAAADPVNAAESGTFNGQAYTRTETKTSPVNLHWLKNTVTTVTYYNDKNQKVGVKSTSGFGNRETTYEYDAAGNISKQVTVSTMKGWTNKPEKGGKEFTRTITTTSVFAYEDVKDAAGTVTGKKVTETRTSTREVNGDDKKDSRGASSRVIVTITDTSGKELSKIYTTNFEDGRKKVTERIDGKWKSTYYDKEGKVYVPEDKKANWKEVVKEVFDKAKGIIQSRTR